MDKEELFKKDQEAQALGFKNYEVQRRDMSRRYKEDVKKQQDLNLKRQTALMEQRARDEGFSSVLEREKAMKEEKQANREKFSTEKVVVPPPMVKKIEALEFVDPNIPGEIKIDTQGKLLKRYFVYEGKIGSLVDQFNNFIVYALPEHITSKFLVLPEGKVSFENIIMNRPMIKNVEGRIEPLYPQKAREYGYSYTADIYMDMVLNKGTSSEERINKAFLGKVPVMIGSELDWLTKKTREERVKQGETLIDDEGYFIIKGTEKIVMIQEKLRANRIFVFNSTSKGDVVCKVTNNTIAGSTQITMARGKKSGAFKVHLGFLGRLGSTNKLGRTISIFQIFRLLGVNKPSEMLNFVYLFTKKEFRKKIYVALQPSIVKIAKIGDDIEYISKKKGLGDVSYEIRKKDIMNDLLSQLFPQISNENKNLKLYMLSMMIGRLVEYFVGARDLDDRDNWGNKQLVTAGKSLELLFSSIWKEAIESAQTEIDEKKLSGLKAAQRVLNSSFITDNFIDSFTPNNWGLQTSYLTKENITDILKRDSILSVYSHLTKINTPGSNKVKSTKIRAVQMSQLGYVDAAETPEGALCGLTKNTAMTAYISLDRPENIIIELLGKYVSSVPTESTINPYILNGVFQGWVNGGEMKAFCLSLKRGLKLSKDTAIVLERDGYFNIYTDACRPTRPLMLVDSDGQLIIAKKNLWDADFETLLREGCVEYVDAWEQENIMLAQSLDDVDFRKRDIEMAVQSLNNAKEKLNRTFMDLSDKKNAELLVIQSEAALKELLDLPPYTHSEMDPTAILSIAVGVIPLPETNPGPRLTYQSGMGKQALGIYHSNHAVRFDTTSKVLAYPSRPMFETQMQNIIGLDDLPAGETVIVAITTYSGFSQEDAIVMSQGAIDRGLFRSIIYKTYKSIRKKTKNSREEFGRPEMKKSEEERYAAIDENGLPRIGSFVKEGDCLIGKIRKVILPNKTEKIENASSFVEVKQEGVVDRVLVSTNSEGEQVVKVKIRQVRKPAIGDKYACYTPDHEVLTLNRSWIPISSLTLEDKVATLVPDDNGDRLVYKNPTALQSFDYEGEMYHIQTQQIDLCVTKNHRMYIKPRDKNKFVIKTAENIYGKRVNYKRDALYKPALPLSGFQIQAYNADQNPIILPIKPFCTIFGIFIAEGWVSSVERFPHRIDIAANKQRVRDALKTACDQLGWKYSNDSGNKKWFIWENQVGEYLRQFSIGAVNKFLPSWCFNLSQENSRILLEGLMLGDGYKSIQSGSYTYYTSSEKLAKDVTQLALHAGWSANSKIRSEAGSQVWYEDEKRYITTTHDAYAVPIIRGKNTPQVNHSHVYEQDAQTEEYIHYKGSIHCCTVDSGIIYVRRNGKPVWCGNSRYAQKGTIGMILPEEDMPFTSAGVRPDLLINPHALPSRMTIGKLIEIVTSKTAAFSGERVNATAFRKFEVEEFMRNLKQYGYSGSGKERLYSGYTGEPLEAMIFIGPCYYQALRHQVADKIQMRARGGVSQLTHQPVGGRKRGGGLRIGEMERDAIISHGASAFLRERLCLVSDAFETVYCSSCGTMAIANILEDKYVCRSCEDNASFGKCVVPYAYKLLTQLLMGAGISTKFTMQEMPK